MTARRALFAWVWGEAPAPARRVATIDADVCLNRQVDMCWTCVERCPVEGAIRREGRGLVVDGARCTGCGECAVRCPAPGYGILLVPAA